MRLFTALFVAVLLPILCNAQSPNNSLQIRWYSTENGLPSNGIKGIQWDKETQFLWIATEAGIVRFNGIEFQTFTKENTPYITAERMRFLIKNSSDKIYACDNNGSTYYIANNKPKLYKKITTRNNELDNRLYKLAINERLFNNNSGASLHPKFFIPSCNIAPISSDSAIILQAGKLYASNGEDNSIKEVNLNNIKPNSLFKIQEHIFVRSTNSEFYELHNNRVFQKTKFNSENLGLFHSQDANPTIFWQTGMKNPILINKNNAWILNFDNNQITTKLICNILPTETLIRYIQYSEEKQMLFLGTDSKGIAIITNNKVSPFKKSNLPNTERNTYYSQVELENGNVLTNEGHEIGNSIHPTTNLPIIGRFNFTTYLTLDSVLWYAQQDEKTKTTILKSYNYVSKARNRYPKIIIDESFGLTKIGEKIYISTRYGLGYLTNDSINYITKPSEEKIISNTPILMEEINPGVLALANCVGLVFINVNSRKIDTILNIPDYCVRTFWKYKNYLFIGTYGKGLFIYKNNSTKALPLDKNKYLLYTHCFAPDQKGYCWMSTNRGLFKAKITDMIDAYENDNQSIYYHYFGRNDGMITTEMNGGCTPCALIKKDGIISFPTMDGLLWVDPKNENLDLPDGNIYIDEITVDGITKEIQTNKSIILDPGAKEIQIKVGYSAWCNMENINLSYQLNDSTTWQPVKSISQSTITLNNLLSGNYKLKIRKLNGYGKDNYSYLQLGFTIKTPWYKKWWFYLICAISIYILGNFYIRHINRQSIKRQKELSDLVSQKTKELLEQNQQLEKNNSIKTRLISIISHDIITPLKFLTVASKKLKDNSNKLSENIQKETLEEITNTSQELQNLSTNILNWIKYQNKNRRITKETFNLFDRTQTVIKLLNPLAKNKNITLENLVGIEISINQYSEPLSILIYNLLTNAINFSEKGNIKVTCSGFGKELTLTIEDQGVGMSETQINNIIAEDIVISSTNVDNKRGNGLGYLIIKDLIKMIDGTLMIESKKGVGTKVSITFPTDLNTIN